MYPNLYYVLKDWFGISWSKLQFLNTFGLMVAMGFATAALILNKELQRKEKQGLLTYREETIVAGKPASLLELLIQALTGFVFGYKLIGLFFSKPETQNAQDYIFSREGNFIGGILVAVVLAGLRWYDKNKEKLLEPQRRNIRIWPHDRVTDIIFLGLVFGILGAKLFDNFENWSEFVKDPIGRLFSSSGLTYYGGLILAAIAICWYAAKRGIKLIHLVDAAAPALILAYAVGRIGCQVAGDGDWGIANSAYITDAQGKVVAANNNDFQNHLITNSTYFLQGKASDGQFVTDRIYPSLDKVPHASFKAPTFLPNWMVAYTYPQNVNKDGNIILNNHEEYNRALPQPVFPTPFYETILCTFIFLFLWNIRKRIKIPGVIFGIYLICNGVERFCVELIRVNNTYTFFGFKATQAELIASALVIIGVLFIFWVTLKKYKYSKVIN